MQPRSSERKATNSTGGSKRRLKSGSGPQRLSTGMKEPTNYPTPGTQSCKAAPGCMKNHQTRGRPFPPPGAPQETRQSHHIRWDGKLHITPHRRRHTNITWHLWWRLQRQGSRNLSGTRKVTLLAFIEKQCKKKKIIYIYIYIYIDIEPSTWECNTVASWCNSSSSCQVQEK